MEKDVTYRIDGYMKRILWHPLILSVVLCISITVLQSYCLIDLCEYSRISKLVFTGFFTLGSLILALKFHLVSYLQKNLYDTTEYQEFVFSKNINANIYAPLQRIVEVFEITMIIMIVSAILNLSTVFITYHIYITIVITITIVALYFLGLTIYVYSVAIGDLQTVLSIKNKKLKEKNRSDK